MRPATVLAAWLLLGQSCDHAPAALTATYDVTSLQGPPPNNDLANATVIATLPFSDVVDLTDATSEPGEPGPTCVGGGQSGHSVWYSFTPPADAVLAPSLDRFFSVVAAYSGSPGSLSEIWCRSPYVVKPWFIAQGGTTYYFQVDGIFGESGSLTFLLEETPPPPNDNFANATAIPTLPFGESFNNTAASTESDEPASSCSGNAIRTAWYAFTPSQTGSISASVTNPGFIPVVTAYRGSALSGLIEVGCQPDYFRPLTFRADAGTTYYFRVGSYYSDQGGPAEFHLVLTPPPAASFYFYPFDPTIFDGVSFYDNSSDPGGLGIQTHRWDFGDGASTTTGECCVTHRYAADGSYAVQLAVTTPDGRTATTSQSVLVRTHDVAITKFAVPKSATAGQTRLVTVGLNSKRYPETVEVQLFKSVPGGYQPVGSLMQMVPVRPANRTTDFSFSYTFTADDARVGKVTFRAVANLQGARDALPADNESIAAPTAVHR